MKKLVKTLKVLALIVPVVLVLLHLVLPGVHSDGKAFIQSQIAVTDGKGHPVEDAELRMTGHDGAEVTLAKSKVNGRAKVNIHAGWSKYTLGFLPNTQPTSQ